MILGLRTGRSRAGFSWIAYLGIIGVGLLIALFSWKRDTGPYFPFAMALLLALLLLWLKSPRAALTATVFFTLVGDLVTISWYPFGKNLSSRESILFVADLVIISPLEMSLIVGIGVVIFRNYSEIGRWSVPAPLLRPFGVFTLFCLLGFVVGIARGGDLRIGLIEIRPLLYLPLMYVLFVNICVHRRDYSRMLGVALAAIFVQSLLSLQYLQQLPAEQRLELETLTEHGSSIGMNLLAVVLILHLLTPRSPKWILWALLGALIPIGWVYIVSERRAAIVALGGAFVLIAAQLWWQQRRMFWKVVPLATVIAVGYLLAFWNVDSTPAFPAQAVKAVVAPDQTNDADRSSDLYRDIERFDLWATIQAEPLFGQGFGRPFLRPIPLPDISVFEFNQYIPHNSVLWIWIKTGFGGFVTLLYLIARGLTLSVERIRRMPAGRDRVVALSMSTFIVMFSIFLFVDIAWEPRNVSLLAMAFALGTGTFVEPHEPESDSSSEQREVSGEVTTANAASARFETRALHTT